MNNTAFKFAASTVVVSLTMVACTAQSEAMRRLGNNVRRADSRTDLQAAVLHEQARRLLQQGQIVQATAPMENAVALAPRDAGYRLLLADIYMKTGRFEAARATFADVVELDPSNVRAALSVALMQIALGRPQAAVAQLDELAGRARAADIGLAYALAGMPERAIEILEPVARSTEATPRLRQNLALSYALAGNWARARTVASQDVSPADLGPRLQQWAAMARPDARHNQVAALLGVTPVQDEGQPIRLALSPAAAEPAAPDPVALAAAPEAPAPIPATVEIPAPAPPAHARVTPVAIPAAAPAAPAHARVTPVVIPAPAPVAPAHASVTPVVVPASTPIAPPVVVPASTPAPATQAIATPVVIPAWTPAPAAEVEAPSPLAVAVETAPAEPIGSHYLPAPEAPVARTEQEVRYALAARSITRPNPAVVRTASVSLPTPPAFRRQTPQSQVRRGDRRIVVQLGAFSNEGNAERAWQEARRRFDLAEQAPLTTTIDIDGRRLHRVSVAGFASRNDAGRFCTSIRSRGGACFVRASAGDASVRWAARYVQGRDSAA